MPLARDFEMSDLFERNFCEVKVIKREKDHEISGRSIRFRSTQGGSELRMRGRENVVADAVGQQGQQTEQMAFARAENAVQEKRAAALILCDGRNRAAQRVARALVEAEITGDEIARGIAVRRVAQ